MASYLTEIAEDDAFGLFGWFCFFRFFGRAAGLVIRHYALGLEINFAQIGSALSALDGRNQVIEPALRGLRQRLGDTRHFRVDPVGQITPTRGRGDFVIVRFAVTAALVIHRQVQPPAQPAFHFEPGHHPFPHPRLLRRAEAVDVLFGRVDHG